MPPNFWCCPSPPGHDTIPRITDFRKSYYFSYGSLKDPARLSHVLDTGISLNQLLPAHIVGYSCEMWGRYKALVDGPSGNIVSGLAYEVQTKDDADKLAHYKTNAYKVVPCRILLDSTDLPEDRNAVFGATFLYAGDPQALRDKRWDRKLWVRDMRNMLSQIGEIPS